MSVILLPMTREAMGDDYEYPAPPPLGPDAELAAEFNNRVYGLYHATGSCAVSAEVLPLCLQDRSVGILDQRRGSIAVINAIGYEVMTYCPSGAVVCTE